MAHLMLDTKGVHAPYLPHICYLAIKYDPL